MDELRFVRREDQTLIVANDADQEFRLVVDDAVLSELRSLSRRERPAGKVRPREIQALIRAGKTRAQVMAETGLEEVDVERYEEPVLAERRYILERAQAVPVRTEAHTDTEERFGAVIQERLITLGADASEWASWRDEEAGWMVSLEFISRDVAHRAVWSFEHRKGTLSPITSDAVTLSKQGDVGDRLIPKLRAVDTGDGSTRFDSGAFETEEAASTAAAASGSPEQQADTAEEPTSQATAEPTPESADAVYERRREIDQRAIKTNETQPVDLSQTADLLDALRRRRGERDQEHRAAALADLTPSDEQSAASPMSDNASTAATAPSEAPSDSPAEPTPGARARSIWGASGVSGSAPPLGSRGRDTAPVTRVPQAPSEQPGSTDTKPVPGPGGPAAPKFRAVPPADEPSPATPATPANTEEPAGKPTKKGRASIPSWDDILFGTRSDDDPS